MDIFPTKPIKNKTTLNNIQEPSNVNNVYYNIPRSGEAMDGRKVDHQSTMVELQGKILDKYVSVLIDPGCI